MKLDDFVLMSSETVKAALKKIDFNNQGFLIVINQERNVQGVLTDGDIRRAFIHGISIEQSIEGIYNKDFSSLLICDNFSKAVKLFKSTKIDFLPIIDDKKRLCNLITKKNMHLLLLNDIEFDWSYNFIDLDNSILDHEIYDRPWGVYKTTFLNPYSQSKILKVKPEKELSLQEHKMREEYWVVISGIGEIILGESKKNIEAGSFIFIPKGCKHKLINSSKDKSLMIAEVQLGDYFGEDDIIRYDNVY